MATYEKTDETNWLRVCKLLIEVGREIFLDIFQTAAQPLTLRQLLLNNKSDIIQQRKDQTLVLNKKQFRLLYYENKKTINKLDLESEYREKKIAKWDISLISVLLNYCSENGILTISDPVHDSHNKIRKLRNVLYAHIGENGCKMTDSEFEIQWHEVVKFLTESAPFNIQDKISSVKKEEIVDGDELKEIFKNWMQRDIEIIDRLDKIEKTSKQGHAKTHQKLAEISQRLQGAEATDRVPRKMHKGEERLSSQVSMDAEPDEDASGENVLADRFPKMTVNEPGDSRDESASSLQSNLTEQRRHNEMPPEIGYIDCLIMYAEADRDGAQKFKEHLINDIKIKEHGPVVALLYDDPKLRSLCECQVKYFEKVCELSTYKMLYMTEHFVNDKWEEFKRNACLVKSIEDETSSVVPVYPQKKKTIKVPIAINSLKGLKYYNNDEHYRQSLANLIEAQVEVRVKGNKNLVEKQKGRDRRDKEIDENHPQQDAFVQTCSQTPGASAEIQEAKTIPDLEEDTTDDVDLASSSHDDKMEQREENKRLEIDKQQQRTDKEIFDSHPQTPGASAEIPTATTIPDLEGDTLDDVDLPSSCHDDKMEQKEEAQIASLAEIKQKKKKKKKKKTRR